MALSYRQEWKEPGTMKPSKRQRLFALLIRDEIEKHAARHSFYMDYPCHYLRFIRSQSNAKPTSAGYPYHLALKQFEARA